MRVKAMTPAEKAEVGAACDALIANTLKPPFLPETKHTAFNYPIDMFGRWRGSKYSFIVRYCSGFPDSLGEEFDAPFARLDHVETEIAELRFDVMWRRHTGQWWRLRAAQPLAAALDIVATEPCLK